MKNKLPLALGALLLAALPLTCYHAALWSERLAEPPGLKESQEGVVRSCRAGMAGLRQKYGTDGPTAAWAEVDRHVWENLAAALRREVESP